MADDQQPDSPTWQQDVADIVKQPTLGGILTNAAGAVATYAQPTVDWLASLGPQASEALKNYDLERTDYDPFTPQGDQPLSGYVAAPTEKAGAGLLTAATSIPKATEDLIATPGAVSQEARSLRDKIASQNYVSEEDAARLNALSGTEMQWAPATAMQMVTGGPGAAEEDAAGIAGGKLKQPITIPAPDWYRAQQDHPAVIDTRLPRAATPVESEGPQVPNVEAMRATPDLYENNVDLVRSYPGIKIPSRASTDTAAQAFVDHAANNLTWLYDQVPDYYKYRSAQWYDGENKIVNDWAQRYGVDDSTVAGVIAATSPQKDWFNNVSLAQRILDTTKGNGRDFYYNFKTSPEMEDWYQRIPALNKTEYQPLFDEIRGKSLGDIDRIIPFPEDERDVLKAMWIRLYDHAHSDPSVHEITPEGVFLPTVSQNVAWGSIPETAKAVSIIDEPDRISDLVGQRHKVRSFYNNLLSPNSPQGDVTVDTHAVAAALLRPVSGNSVEVSHNFSNYPGKGHPGRQEFGQNRRMGYLSALCRCLPKGCPTNWYRAASAPIRSMGGRPRVVSGGLEEPEK